jgi:hypothetical protein
MEITIFYPKKLKSKVTQAQKDGTESWHQVFRLYSCELIEYLSTSEGTLTRCNKKRRLPG